MFQLEGCGKTMSLGQKVDGSQVGYKRRTLPQDCRAREAGRAKRVTIPGPMCEAY